MPSRLPAPVEPWLPNHRSQTKSHPVLAELILRSNRKQCVPCRHKAGEGRFHIMEQLVQSSFITSSQFARKHPGGRIVVQNSRTQELQNSRTQELEGSRAQEFKRNQRSGAEFAPFVSS